MGRVLGNLVGCINELMGKNRLGGQRTDLLARSLQYLSSVSAKQTQERYDSNAENRTMGVAESLIEIG